jgi:hypothetical protein
MNQEDRTRLVEECRAIIESRKREPGEDDVLDDDEEPLGLVLAKIRLGAMRAPRQLHPHGHRFRWIDDVIASTMRLEATAKKRIDEAPWAATQEDIEWRESLKEHLEELRASQRKQWSER